MPEPAISLFIVASWSWTFWHWDISHVIWCELQSVISSQIKPPWPPYCRYCFFYRNSTCKTFLNKIGKNYFCHPPQKSFFPRFLQSSSLNLLKHLIPATFWVLLQVMFMNDGKQTAQRLKLQGRLLRINKRNIIRWNICRDNSFHSRRQVLKCL